MNRADLILIAILTTLSLLPLTNQTQGETVRITKNGEKAREIAITIDSEIRIETPEGFNIVKIEDGTVYVTESNCRDQICVKSKKISNAGESIACLPHRLLIEVK